MHAFIKSDKRWALLDPPHIRRELSNSIVHLFNDILFKYLYTVSGHLLLDSG